MKTITIYLVRHGHAESNALGILSSYPEEPGRTVRHLTERGLIEVRETAEKLQAEEGIVAIIASPLTRTVETATILSEAIGVPVFQDVRLRETDFGVYNEREVAKYFQVYESAEKRIDASGNDGVESTLSQRGRVENFLSDIAREFAGQKIVLVSHGDTLEQIHGAIVGEDVLASSLGWSPKTGSMCKIEWNPKPENR